MRFFSSILAGAALVSAAFGLTIDSYPSSVQVGQTVEIKYSPASATPTFILRQGDPNNLATIAPIDGTGSNGVFKWTVSTKIPNGQQYALEIHANGEVNYSKNDITIGGSTATAVSSGSSSAASSATSSASASAKSTGSTLTTTASVSLSTSSSNSTISLPTLSSKTSSASSTAKTTGSSVTTTGGGAPQNTGAAAQLGSSPLALIFGAVAAMAYLN